MESRKISISLIDANTGQVEGLPKNPRKFSNKEVEKIKKSLSECPEMTDVRPLIVYPHGGRYVVIGGNLRLEGFRALGVDDVPCVVLPDDMGVDKLKEITIKDNGSFGTWDFDILDSDWGDLTLENWGVEVQITAEEEVKKLKKGEFEGDVPFAEQLGEEHNYVCLYFDNEVDWLQAQTLLGIKAVQCPSTKKDGKGFMKFGIGRVINGAKAIQKLLNR